MDRALAEAMMMRVVDMDTPTRYDEGRARGWCEAIALVSSRPVEWVEAAVQERRKV